MPTGKLAKWQIILSEFDIVYITQNAIKGQALADHSLRIQWMGITNHLPPNFKGVRIGAVLISVSGKIYPASSKIRFPCTNNIAEYEACILGIRMTVDMNCKEPLVIGDSDLLIHQVQGELSTKNVKIMSYMHCVKELCNKFTKIDFKHVPKIQNVFVDALTTLSSMIQHSDKNYIDPIEIEIKDQHAYYFHMNEEPDGRPW
ncbi:uncharacterized protein LOC142163986 [Nicotiana tabacum]|uniref:Uncharacterized protein LOC142163986 n=1 Tax=Nicotiana tabacum TaxID=4097 RepID=A0AC58RWX9_TOBAC